MNKPFGDTGHICRASRFVGNHSAYLSGSDNLAQEVTMTAKMNIMISESDRKEAYLSVSMWRSSVSGKIMHATNVSIF